MPCCCKVRDLCVVFVTAVDPAVAKLLLLLASLESCCFCCCWRLFFAGVSTDNYVLAFTVVTAVAGISAIVDITAVAASTGVAGVTGFDGVPVVEYILY